MLFLLDDVLVEVVKAKVGKGESTHALLDLRRLSDDFLYENVPEYYVKRLKDDP